MFSNRIRIDNNLHESAALYIEDFLFGVTVLSCCCFSCGLCVCVGGGEVNEADHRNFIYQCKFRTIHLTDVTLVVI